MEAIGGAGKMNKDIDFDMDYTAEYLYRLIRNKRTLIDMKNQGNFRAVELLYDIEMLEQRYLTNNQRVVIYYVFELGYTIKYTAEILDVKKDKIFEILDSIFPTLQKQMS
jgi:hypothetical protein